MRRQVGADAVEIDTEAEYARADFGSPHTIDPAVADEAATGAGYTVEAMEVEIDGVVERAPCAACGEEVPMLVVRATGQRLELAGDVPVGDSVRLRARTSSWSDGHVRWSVVDYSDLP